MQSQFSESPERAAHPFATADLRVLQEVRVDREVETTQ